MSWAGHVASMGDRRGAYRVLVGRPRHRWKDNIRMYTLEVGWGGGINNCSGSELGHVAGTCEFGDEPS